MAKKKYDNDFQMDLFGNVVENLENLIDLSESLELDLNNDSDTQENYVKLLNKVPLDNNGSLLENTSHNEFKELSTGDLYDRKSNITFGDSQNSNAIISNQHVENFEVLQPERQENSRSLGIPTTSASQRDVQTERNEVINENTQSTDIGRGNFDTNEFSRFTSEGVNRDGSISTESNIDRFDPIDDVEPQAVNYTITYADNLGEGGAKTKFKNNIAALKLLKQLQIENRQANTDEQSILVKYNGWGGIPQAFDDKNPDWHNEYNDLLQLLPTDEYNKARRSTLDSHYTPTTIINGIYEGLAKAGFKQGNILEPSSGTGNFIGLIPDEMKESKFTCVEMEPLTSDLSKQLYPQAFHLNDSLQNINFPESSFDVVLGNPPFGSQKLNDFQNPEIAEFSIHNYFIAKSINAVKPGGISAFVVSRHFLDSKNKSAREYIANKAHFLGGIRLPYTAFKNAGTDVTTDIVFFQKALPDEEINKDWIEVKQALDSKFGELINVNAYFYHNADQVIGTMQVTNKGREGRVDCVLDNPTIDLEDAIKERLNFIPNNCYIEKTTLYEAINSFDDNEDIAKENKELIALEEINNEIVGIGSFFITPKGKLATREANIVDLTDGASRVGYSYYEPKNNTEFLRINGLIGIRDATYTLINSEQKESTSDDELVRLRAKLNRLYDNYTKKYGFLNSQVNRSAFVNDPSFALIQSLERDYDKGISKAISQKTGEPQRSATANKADIFYKRVLKPKAIITHVNTAIEALTVSMNETGIVDPQLMSRLMGKPFNEFKDELNGLIYAVPGKGTWETKERYLTGNVKEKLAIAKEYGAEENIAALEAVQPADIDPIDIAVQLNSSWLPKEDIEIFVKKLLGDDVHFNFSFQPSIGRWLGEIRGGGQVANDSTWGTEDYKGRELIDAILTNTSIKVNDMIGKDDNGKPIYKLNPDKTAAANQKADEIKQAFQDWIWEDEERRERLGQIYNSKFNNTVPRKYDGSHLKLEGMSQTINLRPHQKNAIWRGIQEGTAMFDHEVGAGKTMVCIGTMIEQKRMGLVNKPMVVVPNHLLLQWKDEIYKMYPNAKVLVAGKEDFTKEKRQRLFGKIATGDWDAVIVGHSSFKKIAMPKDTLDEILTEQVNDITNAIAVLEYEEGNKITIKQLEQIKERFQTKLEKKADQTNKDKVVTFDQLGIDCLLVDESQEFKNLYIPTSMSNVAGLGDLSGSDKAFDLFVKARYLQERNGGKGLYFATGTSVSNTIAEVYTLQRYMQYDTLKKEGINHFDSWASTFGQVVTGWELDATGVNYKINNRFSKFQNMPELMSMYRSFADVISEQDLHQQAAERGERFPTPKIKGGKPTNVIVERTKRQEDYMGYQIDTGFVNDDGLPIKKWNEGSIIWRMENLPTDPSEDNPLKITNDARKAGLDFRLIDPEAEDEEITKVNAAVDNIYRVWKENDYRKGTQLVFCDLSTPKKARTKKDKHYEILDGATSTERDDDNKLISVYKTIIRLDNGIIADASSYESAKHAVDLAVSQAIETSRLTNKATKLAPEIIGDELEDSNEIQEEANDSFSMDEILADTNGSFNVYDDIKNKLVAKGVPENEIRFIHEANTDLQKQKLFSQMNKGEARILLGSTTKMGAGTNVQKKLVALHDIDCPWRPSDLQQRKGRIIRQGNEFYEEDPDNFEVEMFRYSTKQTYDARMWQVIEQKATSIEQFRRGDMQQRVIDDVVGEAANAAEMKAASTGNQLIFAQVQISSELKKIEAVYNSYKRNLHSLQKRINQLEKSPKKRADEISLIQENIRIRDASTPEDKNNWSIEDTKGNKYNEKHVDHLKNYFANAFKESKRLSGVTSSLGGSKVEIGSYRGFQMTAYTVSYLGTRNIQIRLSNSFATFEPENLMYRDGDSFSLSGFIKRANNFLDSFEKQVEKHHSLIENDKQELIQANEQLNKPFPQQTYLEALREDSRQVITELKKTQADDSYKSNWIPKVESFGLKLGLENDREKTSDESKMEPLISPVITNLQEDKESNNQSLKYRVN